MSLIISALFIVECEPDNLSIVSARIGADNLSIVSIRIISALFLVECEHDNLSTVSARM